MRGSLIDAWIARFKANPMRPWPDKYLDTFLDDPMEDQLRAVLSIWSWYSADSIAIGNFRMADSFIERSFYFPTFNEVKGDSHERIRPFLDYDQPRSDVIVLGEERMPVPSATGHPSLRRPFVVLKKDGFYSSSVYVLDLFQASEIKISLSIEDFLSLQIEAARRAGMPSGIDPYLPKKFEHWVN